MACVKSFVLADTEIPRTLPVLFLNIHKLTLRMCVLSRVSEGAHLVVSTVSVDVQQGQDGHEVIGSEMAHHPSLLMNS